MDGIVHRPRNVDWRRAAGLLYGDWGTSKAYVLGLAFTCPIAVANGYHSLWVILAVCALTALVGYNYVVICSLFPDGGGVYSAARTQNRILAVMGALLLVANFTVTAAMSGWAAMSYFGFGADAIRLCTLILIGVIGILNFFGPKHTGSLAIWLAIPMMVVVAAIILLATPHFTTAHLASAPPNFSSFWLAFTWSILALSGVEAVASLTGVMKLDPGSSMEEPKVAQTARKAILVVALEVVVGTSLLGWAMLSLPQSYEPQIQAHSEYMLRFLGHEYATILFGQTFGNVFAVLVGIVVGFLLLSAVNTAITALIGLFYMMARDGEMPRSFSRLNRHGVPWIPMLLAVALPAVVTATARDLESLAGLYAIGVVGAIAVNLGSCTFNTALPLHWFQRGIMGITFVILAAIELTIAKTRGDALFFACVMLLLGMTLRNWAQRRAGLRTLTVSEQVAAVVSPDLHPEFQPKLTSGQTILVAARGLTPVVRFALEEARLRKANLYLLYVREIAVTMPGPLLSSEPKKWQDDKSASAIIYPVLKLAQEHQISLVPLYTISDNPAGTILDLAATLGADILILGSPHRRRLVRLLKGNVVTEVAKNLPESIQLIIYG